MQIRKAELAIYTVYKKKKRLYIPFAPVILVLILEETLPWKTNFKIFIKLLSVSMWRPISHCRTQTLKGKWTIAQGKTCRGKYWLESNGYLVPSRTDAPTCKPRVCFPPCCCKPVNYYCKILVELVERFMYVNRCKRWLITIRESVSNWNKQPRCFTVACWFGNNTRVDKARFKSVH